MTAKKRTISQKIHRVRPANEVSAKEGSYKQDVQLKLYQEYYAHFHAQEYGLEYTSRKILIGDVLKRFKERKAVRVLDAGCGDGIFIEEANRQGFSGEGFDSNENQLNMCRKKGLAVKNADFGKRLPYDDGTFDGIYCAHVFEHLLEPDFALHELLRICKKDGTVIIAVPDADDLFYSEWTHVKKFTKNTFRNIMRCFPGKKYAIYKRHYPVLVKYWSSPFVRAGNHIIKRGLPAQAFTIAFEKATGRARHDLTLEIHT